MLLPEASHWILASLGNMLRCLPHLANNLEGPFWPGAMAQGREVNKQRAQPIPAPGSQGRGATSKVSLSLAISEPPVTLPLTSDEFNTAPV